MITDKDNIHNVEKVAVVQCSMQVLGKPVNFCEGCLFLPSDEAKDVTPTRTTDIDRFGHGSILVTGLIERRFIS
jgi:hypothetical protein